MPPPRPLSADARALAAFAHKLGSPLGAIRNYVALADDPELFADVAEGIQNSTHRMTVLLDGARRWLEAAAMDVETEALDPAPIVRRAAARVEGDLALDVPGTLPATVASAAALEEQLVEVITNAVQATAGLSRVSVSADGDDEVVRLRIRDRGAGWTEEEARRAFLPFTTLSERRAGAGVGLPLVALLAARQDGRAYGEPAPDGGAVVVIELPRAP